MPKALKRVFGSKWTLGLALLGLVRLETQRDKQGRLECISLSISAPGDVLKLAVVWNWK